MKLEFCVLYLNSKITSIVNAIVAWKQNIRTLLQNSYHNYLCIIHIQILGYKFLEKKIYVEYALILEFIAAKLDIFLYQLKIRI